MLAFAETYGADQPGAGRAGEHNPRQENPDIAQCNSPEEIKPPIVTGFRGKWITRKSPTATMRRLPCMQTILPRHKRSILPYIRRASHGTSPIYSAKSVGCGATRVETAQHPHCAVGGDLNERDEAALRIDGRGAVVRR